MRRRKTLASLRRRPPPTTTLPLRNRRGCLSTYRWRYPSRSEAHRKSIGDPSQDCSSTCRSSCKLIHPPSARSTWRIAMLPLSQSGGRERERVAVGRGAAQRGEWSPPRRQRKHCLLVRGAEATLRGPGRSRRRRRSQGRTTSGLAACLHFPATPPPRPTSRWGFGRQRKGTGALQR